MLALASSLAVKKCCGNRLTCLNASQFVWQDCAYQAWALFIGTRLYCCQRRDCLNEWVINWFIAIGTFKSKACD